MADEDLLKMYKEAIEVCEKWRLGNGQFGITSATPNQLHIYNIFTQAKGQLSGHLATIEDTLGTYLKKPSPELGEKKGNL